MTERLISIIKFAVAILILPVLIAVTISLYNHAANLPKGLGVFFLWGIVSYLILHLFIGEPTAIYQAGQDLSWKVFQFFPALAKAASLYLPIYTTIILLIYLISALFSGLGAHAKIFCFLVGFSVSLHIVNSAKSLSMQAVDFLKGHYFLVCEFVLIFNIIITAAALKCLSADFSFGDFFIKAVNIKKDIYFAVFRQLFF